MVLRRWPAPAFPAKLLVAIRGDDGAWAVTDAAAGGIADRGGGRNFTGSSPQRRPNSAAGTVPVHINRCRYARAREESGGNNRGSSCFDLREPAVWCCDAGRRRVSDLALKLLVAIRGDDGAWAVTDEAAAGGIADRGGGRGSLPGHRHSARRNSAAGTVPVHLNRCRYARARGRAAATTGIELLDLRGPAGWCCDAGRRRRFRFSEIVGRDSRRRWSLGGDRRCCWWHRRSRRPRSLPGHRRNAGEILQRAQCPFTPIAVVTPARGESGRRLGDRAARPARAGGVVLRRRPAPAFPV